MIRWCSFPSPARTATPRSATALCPTAAPRRLGRTLRLARLLGIGAAVGLSLPTPVEAAPARAPKSARAPAAPALSFDAPTETATVLVGAQIHVGDGTVIDDGVVEIRGDRIVSVGRERTEGSADATVIDLAGQRITPGFIAAAAPLGLVEIDLEKSTIDAERKDEHPVRSGFDVSRAVNADSSLLPVAAIEGVTSAAVTPRGGLLSGQVAWIDLVAGDYRTIVSRPRIAISGQLGQQVAGSRAASFAALERALDDARFYRDRRAAYDRRQTRELGAHRLDLEALEPVLDGTTPLVVHAHRASDLMALADLATRSGLRVVVVGAAQGWKVAETLAAAKIAVVVQPSANLPRSFDELGARRDSAARLHEAGVRVGIAVLDDEHNVRNLGQEAGIAVAHGLPPQIALGAVTLELARIYGMDDHYGSIAVGKVANLAVWAGDPFELSQVPTQVYIRGRAIPMRSRQTLLRDRYRDLRRFESPHSR
ncbi:MAG: amidohydrolase family protein [Myxococcota bacterium]